MEKNISAPDFFADDFEKILLHPNPAPDSVEKSVERVYLLISQALKNLEFPDWNLAYRRYHSIRNLEPYCFSRIGEKFYIWTEERGNKQPIAIFKNRYIAAEYFVWLVSNGVRKIDWSLFMEMEP